MCHWQKRDERWKVRLIIAQSTKALSDPQKGENHPETQELALSSRHSRALKVFTKQECLTFIACSYREKRIGGWRVNAFTKGNKDIHPYAQRFESHAPKHNRRASGHPLPTKSKPQICLRICSLQQHCLNSCKKKRADLSKILIEGGSQSFARKVWRMMTFKMGALPFFIHNLSWAWCLSLKALQWEGAVGGNEATTGGPKR